MEKIMCFFLVATFMATVVVGRVAKTSEIDGSVIKNDEVNQTIN